MRELIVSGTYTEQATNIYSNNKNNDESFQLISDSLRGKVGRYLLVFVANSSCCFHLFFFPPFINYGSAVHSQGENKMMFIQFS